MIPDSLELARINYRDASTCQGTIIENTRKNE